jgi:ABC-type glycerol-3-phosphate transport system permease component
VHAVNRRRCATGTTRLPAAGVLMTALPMVVFFILVERYIIRGATAGAVNC